MQAGSSSRVLHEAVLPSVGTTSQGLDSLIDSLRPCPPPFSVDTLTCETFPAMPSAPSVASPHVRHATLPAASSSPATQQSQQELAASNSWTIRLILSKPSPVSTVGCPVHLTREATADEQVRQDRALLLAVLSVSLGIANILPQSY